MIGTLSERFDVIVFDSPPLLSVTDGLILSQHLDGTLIVAKAGKTTYDSMARALKSLKGRRKEDISSHVIGIVINAFDLRKSSIYYHQYQNYYYTAEETKSES